MVFTREDAARAAQTIGIDFKKEAFQLEDLLNGMNTELARHGTKAGTVDVTHDDPTMTAKLAVANLRVSPSYYSQRGEKRMGTLPCTWSKAQGRKDRVQNRGV